MKTVAQILAAAQALTDVRICGVYFLIRQGVIVYVGQSVDVIGRVRGHAASGKAFDRYAVHECAESELDVLESRYIYALSPEYNGYTMATARGPLRLLRAPLRRCDLPLAG